MVLPAASTFFEPGDIRETNPLLGVQSIAVERIHHRVMACRLAIITGRQVNEDIAIGGVAFEIPFERFSVHRYAFELALEALLQIRERLNEVVATLRPGSGIILRQQKRR